MSGFGQSSSHVRTYAQFTCEYRMSQAWPILIRGDVNWRQRQQYAQMRKPNIQNASGPLTVTIAQEPQHSVLRSARTSRCNVRTRAAAAEPPLTCGPVAHLPRHEAGDAPNERICTSTTRGHPRPTVRSLLVRRIANCYRRTYRESVHAIDTEFTFAAIPAATIAFQLKRAAPPLTPGALQPYRSHSHAFLRLQYCSSMRRLATIASMSRMHGNLRYASVATGYQYPAWS